MREISSIFILAKLNAREWIRLKFFHIVVFFALVFIGFSHLLSTLTFSVQERLLYDFGLAGLELGLVVISSLIGSHSIQREIDRKTLFVLLSRPIPRRNIVIGAWLSIISLCALFTVGFLFSFVVSSSGTNYYLGLLLAAYSLFLKTLVISSFALACGLIVRPILALGTTVSYWILCYSLPDIQFFVAKLKDDFLLKLVGWIEIFIPQFYRYNWKSYYYVLNPHNFADFGWATLHSLGWAFFWIFIASLFFRRKEIV